MQGYFAAETGDFNLFARPIPNYDLERKSFTNTVTKVKILFKYDMSVESWAMITALGDTLQD